MRSKWAHFLGSRLSLESILLKYATLMSFDAAATLMYTLLQAKAKVYSALEQKNWTLEIVLSSIK